MTNSFSAICFIVLMDNKSRGPMMISPDYLEEKLSMLKLEPLGAFSRLDHGNQTRVLTYCHRWDIKLPAEIMQYVRETTKGLLEEMISMTDGRAR